MKLSYYQWIAEFCTLLGLPKVKGADFVKDISLIGCWDDGMSPQDAIDEATTKGVLEHYKA